MDLPFYIENRDSFRVVGYLMKTTNQKGQGRKAIPLHWSNFRKDNLETRMLALAEQKADGLFGINTVSYTHLDVYKRPVRSRPW